MRCVIERFYQCFDLQVQRFASRDDQSVCVVVDANRQPHRLGLRLPATRATTPSAGTPSATGHQHLQRVSTSAWCGSFALHVIFVDVLHDFCDVVDIGMLDENRSRNTVAQRLG